MKRVISKVTLEEPLETEPSQELQKPSQTNGDLFPLRAGCTHKNTEIRNYDSDTKTGDVHCKECAGYVGQYNNGVITNA